MCLSIQEVFLLISFVSLITSSISHHHHHHHIYFLWDGGWNIQSEVPHLRQDFTKKTRWKREWAENQWNFVKKVFFLYVQMSYKFAQICFHISARNSLIFRHWERTSCGSLFVQSVALFFVILPALSQGSSWITTIYAGEGNRLCKFCYVLSILPLIPRTETGAVWMLYVFMVSRHVAVKFMEFLHHDWNLKLTATQQRNFQNSFC